MADSDVGLQRNKLKVTEDNSHEEGELSPKSDELANNGHGNKAAVNLHTDADGSDRLRFLCYHYVFHVIAEIYIIISLTMFPFPYASQKCEPNP